MSICWVVRHGQSLVGADTDSVAVLGKLPFGKLLRCEVKEPRNAGHHRLFWATCQRIADAIGSNADTVCDVLKVETNHCTWVKTKTHGRIPFPKSISFAKMDQQAFETFWESCLNVIFNEWGIERGDILAAVADILTPTEDRAA
jgi:hypothetical protein